MELRDKVLEEESVYRDAKLWGIGRDPSKQVDGPTANNVVGNLDHFYLLVFQRG